jgi:hypothetical protein
MSISGNGGVCNCDPTRTMQELSEFVSAAVRGGVGMRDFERELFDRLLAVGSAHQAAHLKWPSLNSVPPLDDNDARRTSGRLG